MSGGLARHLAVYGVMDMDWARFAARRGLSAQGEFSLLPITVKDGAEDTKRIASDFPPDLKDETGALRPEPVLAGLRRIAARLLGQHEPERIAPDAPLADYGFDSLMAVEFRARVSEALAMRVPLSLTFEYPTLEKIRDWLCMQGARAEISPPVPGVSASGEQELDDFLEDIDALLGKADSLPDAGP
jgi:acyl carrier protein